MKGHIWIFVGAMLLALTGCTTNGLQLGNEACTFAGVLLADNIGVRNGDPAPNCASGTIVFISTVITDGSRYDCTGSLIRNNAVLTAAHCVADPSISLTKTTFVSVPGISQPIPASGSVASPGYTPNGVNTNGIDVALIFLSQPVTSVSPATIATTIPPVGASVTDYGYGYDGRGSDGDGDFGTLLTGSLKVIGYFNDPSSYHGSAPMGILAQANTSKSQETCEGDSGGPLVYNGVVVGILSGGDATSDACQGSTNSAYTSVAAAQSWIQSTLASH